MLSVQDLTVSIDEKEILSSFSFDFPDHQITAILGHNGSGKSSLAATIMGHPKYMVNAGKILFDHQDILALSPDARARLGIFLSFQNVPEIPGIRLIEYLRTIYVERFQQLHPDTKPPTLFIFRRMVEKLLPGVGLGAEFLDRDLYVGFSGGEKRRIEMLQIDLLDPDCIILDEIDAGLDIAALQLLKIKIDTWKKMSKTIIIISHNFHLLDSIDVDRVMLMSSGQYITHGDRTLVQRIQKDGFDTLIPHTGQKQ